MKFTVTQENLSKALNNVSRIASSRAGMPILSNILLKAEGNQLILSATNLEVAIVENINANVSKEGSTLLPARLVNDFVSNLPHAKLSLELKDNKINIKCDSYKSTINVLPINDYPAIPEITKGDSIKVRLDDFKKAINLTAPIAGNDVSRPLLTGVNIYSNDGYIYMVATDGYRLAEKKLTDSKKDFNFLVPATSLIEFGRVFSGRESIEVYFSDDQVSFISDNTVFTSRLIDDNFINYKQLIPSDNKFTAKVNKDELIKITKIAQLFARETSGTITLDLNSDDKKLSIYSITSELGNNSSSIEANISGGNSSVNANSKFLIDALNCIDGDDVEIGFSSKVSPILIKGKDDSYIHIVMPVKS